MRISTLAVNGALILLTVAPSAFAQDANRAYREAMDRATKQRTVSPIKPEDKSLTCAQIQIELARLDRVIAGDAGAVRAQADAEDMAKPAELLEGAVAKRLRDAANRVAPVGTAPGNLIEEAYREKARIRTAIRQTDYHLLATNVGKDFNFIAARIPYLHKLAGERCTPDEQEAIARQAAASGGPASQGTSPGRRRTITRIDQEQGGIVGGAMGNTRKGP